MRFASIVLSLILAAAGSVITQAPPDINGTWVATKDAPPAMPAAPSAVFGDRFALRSEGGNLTLLRPVRGRTTAFLTVHPLDGTETRIMSPSRPCLGQSGQTISTAWVGDGLRYTIAGSIAPGGLTPTRVGLNYTFRKLSADTLVVESTMRDSAGAEPRAVGTVYRRSTETLVPGPVAGPPVAPATLAQVAWISGDWVSANGTTLIEERWSPGNGGAMIATSRTLRGDVMTEFEFLCLAERDGTLVYTAMPNAGAQTEFTLTRLDADSATFENPAHDFPKMIRYARLPDGSMEAVVSGAANSRPRTFVFKRKVP